MSFVSAVTDSWPTAYLLRLVSESGPNFGFPAVATVAKRHGIGVPRWIARLGPGVIVFCALFGIVVAIQLAVGAYRGERSNQPDEATHFMNGLLVRDYLKNGLGQNPLRFAEEYYLSYPKIAPGMWPPLFHVVLGLFMLPGWPPAAAALALVALASTWTAWRLYRIVNLSAPAVIAFVVAVVFVSTPIVANLTSSVMLDIVVAALALEATYWLARFFETEDWRHAVWFGLLAAFCCLTKGNGVSMVLVPPLLVLFTGRFSILRRAGLYLAAAIVVVLAVPFLAISYRLDAAIGDFHAVNAQEVIHRISFYSTYLVQQLTTLPVLLALVGITGTLSWKRTSDRHCAIGPSMTALVTAAMVFHVLNPHQVIDGRYIALAIPPLFGLMMLGVADVRTLTRSSKSRAVLQTAIFAAVVITFLVGKPAMATRAPIGCRDVIGLLDAKFKLAGRRLLIASDETGEGACVSEVAVRGPVPTTTVIRGSKLVATDDWGGRGFRMLHASPAALLQELEDLHVDYLIVDYSPKAIATPYWSQVNELVRTNQSRIDLIHSTDSNSSRPLVLYRLKFRSPGPPKKLRIPLTSSLGRVLER